MAVQLEQSWLALLQGEFEKPYMHALKSFLLEEQKQHTIYPANKNIFNAFNTTPFGDVKVVILGQDPYHEPRQAHGLCFSVPDGIEPPPSLRNIFTEIRDDLNKPIPTSGNLTRWATQGVFLLNTILTVRAHQAASHRNSGWEQFTDEVIRVISAHKLNVVFILWGNNARSKKILIDSSKHLILEAVHPSPLSANRGGFFGCKHFSQCNEYLVAKGIAPIEW